MIAPSVLHGQEKPRIGSLCSGYEGLGMAVQAVLGGDLAWVSDIDPGACRILMHRYPTVPNLGDLTTTDWTAVEPVDVLTAGYPCQPFSHAGKRKGTADERHLWPYVAGAVRVLRPGLCVFENVAGHVSLGLDSVLADLAGLGYVGCWGVLRASEAGAPHGRARVFIVGHDPDAADLGRRDRPGQLGGVGPEGLVPLGTIADAHNGPEQFQRACEGPRVGGSTTTNADGLGLERLGDAWGRRAGSADESLIATDSSGHRRFEGWSEPARIIGRPDAAKRSDVDWRAYTAAVRRWERVLGRTAPPPTELTAKGTQRLSPRFVEWMMGLPDGWVCDVPGLSRVQQLKALGNGVVPQQAALALSLLFLLLDERVAA